MAHNSSTTNRPTDSGPERWPFVRREAVKNPQHNEFMTYRHWTVASARRNIETYMASLPSFDAQVGAVVADGVPVEAAERIIRGVQGHWQDRVVDGIVDATASTATDVLDLQQHQALFAARAAAERADVMGPQPVEYPPPVVGTRPALTSLSPYVVDSRTAVAAAYEGNVPFSDAAEQTGQLV